MVQANYVHTETLLEKIVRVISSPSSTKEDYLKLGVEIGMEKNKAFTYTPSNYPFDTIYSGNTPLTTFTNGVSN